MFEPTAPRRMLRSILGHLGLGYAVRFWKLKRILRTIRHPVRDVLDFGCSDGMLTFYVARQFPDASILAVDGDPEAIDRATQIAAKNGYEKVTFRASPFEDALPEENRYDLILCLDAIHYTTRGHHYIERLCAALRPGGTLILSLPYLDRHYRGDFMFFGGSVERDSLIELYRPDAVADTIVRSGLTGLERITYPDPIGLRFIRDQADRKRYVVVLYPFTLACAWIGSFRNCKTGTHEMMRARKPAGNG